MSHKDSAINRVGRRLAARSGPLPFHQLTHQQNPQFTQRVNRQRHIPLLPGQLIRQVKQQRSNRRKGFIAIGNQHFTAGIVSNAEQRRRVRGRRLQRFCPRVEVVINRTMRRLIQFQVGTVPQPCTRGGVESDTGVSGSSASCMADSAFSL